MLRRRAFAVFLFLLALSGVQTSWAEDIADEDCLACHEQFNLTGFQASVHSGNGCTSCHADITELPHADKLKPVDCSTCHEQEVSIYKASDHGRAQMKRMQEGGLTARCTTCHGDNHDILGRDNPQSPIYHLNIAQTCGKCHEALIPTGAPGHETATVVQMYEKSVHGRALAKGNVKAAVCTDCHGSHALNFAGNSASSIYRVNLPHTCGQCHANISEIYVQSIHGRNAQAGVKDAPVCTDCHGEHNILAPDDPKSSVYAANIASRACAQCHAAERIVKKYKLPSHTVETYLESYHGLAGKLGVTNVANCASCHGVHDILPANDPASTIHPNNLPETCGKCHPGVGEQLAGAKIHNMGALDENKVIFYVTQFYIVFIFLAIGGMILHNVLDFRAKFKKHLEEQKASGRQSRFNPQERLQHTILFVSFTLLVYSGFALRYADAWWASPFRLFNTTLDWRGIIHRGAAIVFSCLAFFHLGYLLFTPRGRFHISEFFWKKKDLTDFIEMQKYNLGFSKVKPKHDHYSYAEKMEYWALIWGTVVMMATGAVLTFENFSLKYIPKWGMDLATAIHFYEAVLATLAILVWHFYLVIFDPDQYPLNLSMGSGRDSKDEKEPKK